MHKTAVVVTQAAGQHLPSLQSHSLDCVGATWRGP